MEIDNALITQWEPKIQRKVAKTVIWGMDRDDLAQELRIAIIKSSKAFKTDKDSIFHTYLHTSMVKTIKTLISKAYKGRMSCRVCRKNNLINADTCAYCLSEAYLIYCLGFDAELNDLYSWVSFSFRKLYSLKKIENVPLEGYDVEDPAENYSQIELNDLLKKKKLSAKENIFIQLRLEGLTMEEITEDLGESAYRIRQTLRDKFECSNGKQKIIGL